MVVFDNIRSCRTCYSSDGSVEAASGAPIGVDTLVSVECFEEGDERRWHCNELDSMGRLASGRSAERTKEVYIMNRHGRG